MSKLLGRKEAIKWQTITEREKVAILGISAQIAPIGLPAIMSRLIQNLQVVNCAINAKPNAMSVTVVNP